MTIFITFRRPNFETALFFSMKNATSSRADPEFCIKKSSSGANDNIRIAPIPFAD
jgi:hypothetical protein